MKCLFLFCVILFSCRSLNPSYVGKNDMFFKEFIEELKIFKNDSSINKNGFFYTSWDKLNRNSIHIFDNPMIFFSNGLIYECRSSAYADTSYYIKEINSKIIFKERWGVYKIQDKVIKAIIPTNFFKRGLVSKFCLAHYEGILVRSDSITNWRMVPPFPTNIDYELNKDVIQSYQKPHSFSFYKNDIVLKIDTVGAWFNKYLKK